MKFKFRIFLLLVVSALVMMPLMVAYGSGVYENPAPGTFQTPALQGTPERLPSSGLSRYQIGFRDSSDNSCRVEAIKAESSAQALRIAQNECPTCSVQDLNGKEVTTAKAPFYTVPLSVAFCDRPTYH